MAGESVLVKGELEYQLKEEHRLIKDGVLKDDSPLDKSEEFGNLCYACRVGDLKSCQEAIATGVNINARDSFDNTPLILASLCGHYEVVQLLLESGALCERDTFQGERCLYNALNNRIRNLLLQYDYSKSTDPLQPLASHITTLLTRDTPKTADIVLTASSEIWNLHKFVLSARSPYFQKKLSAAPETTIWKMATKIPPESFQIALRYLYLGTIPSDLGISSKSFVSEDEVLKGVARLSTQLEIDSLWGELAGGDRRIARQNHQEEVTRGRNQIEAWYRGNVLKHKVYVPTSKVHEIQWTQNNGIFADVLLRADEPEEEDPPPDTVEIPSVSSVGIPIGLSSVIERKVRQSVLFPVHRAMLLRSEYFQTMFTSSFIEGQVGKNLRIINMEECTPAVLEIVLDFLYTESAQIPLSLALDTLYAADMLFIEKLKTKAAIIVSTIGNGSTYLTERTHLEGDGEEVEVEPINVYDVIRASWDLKVQRLEEFSARYIAYRLEDYIDEAEFQELIKESAERIQGRQETDSIELLDDIRYYLSERFQLRFEDSGIDDMMDEIGEINEEAAEVIAGAAAAAPNDEAIDVGPATKAGDVELDPFASAQIRTLNGDIADDVFAADAINYQILLGKIDALLHRLQLDA
ncbi:hypothetical protein BJ878DRAFT_414879 [Calycina marina]|uniref:BTB domain-containing protein n=1 Tax=Calycina marina TaxID=1763456 RepID=A0A9P7Z8A3_9HELO|nr:hypothetical protein BJ878DRAFT_414879 [Calycina marina]